MSLTTLQAARRLGISARRVRAMIANGQISAEMIGRDWLIPEMEVQQRLKSNPGPGRPVKKREVFPG